jgi:endonuclease/exonuclease/phosphatase family metal-dependent hydrolase
MRVMTFNLRFENHRDGVRTWFFRREQVADLVLRYAPDMLGTQEGMWHQLLYLRDHLPGYGLHAPERVLDATCQYPSLFFKARHLTPLEGGEFWLSRTPRTHRSKSWDSAFPRMMSHGKFEWEEGGIPVWAGVTHLDHAGPEARLQQARIIAGWFKKVQGPAILMGDFNDRPGSPAHGVLTASGTGLRDSWELLDGEEGEASYTHHGFSGVPGKSRMDWIMASSHFRVKRAEIIRDHINGAYPSDHFPYLVDLEFLNQR